MRDACSHFFKSYASNDARNAYLKIRCADTSGFFATKMLVSGPPRVDANFCEVTCQIAVPDQENVASIPTTEETLISPYCMDHRLECLIDAAFADRSPMLVDTKFRVSAFPTLPIPSKQRLNTTNNQPEEGTSQKYVTCTG